MEDWDNEDWTAGTTQVPSAVMGHNNRDRDNRSERSWGNRDSGNSDQYSRRHNDASTGGHRDHSGSKYNNDRHRDGRSHYRSDDNDRQSKRASEFDDRRSGFGSNRESYGDGAHVVVDIDINMAGKVIGSGGSQVREIQDKFRVKVQVGMLDDRS